MNVPAPLRLAALSFAVLASRLRATEPLRLFVAPDGSDTWSGRAAAPTADGHDGPVATFERARDLARTADKDAGVVITIAAGVYPRSRPLQLSAADSGSAAHPVVWQAAPGAHVGWTGAVTVDHFAPVTDPAVRARLAPAARDAIVQAHLRAQGVTDYGVIEPRGSAGLELYYRGRRMQLARYPNHGWLHIASVPQTGPRRFYDGVARELRFADGIPAGRHYGRIRFDDTRPTHWAPAPDIYAHGYWTFDWSDSYQRIQSLDAAHGELTFAEPHHPYGYTRGQRFYFLNILEELDEPGEWYLDRTQGELYFYPPEPIRAGDVQVTTLAAPFVELDHGAHVQLTSLDFSTSRGGGVVLRDSTDCAVAGCRFHNLGALAADIEGGAANTIQSCDFFDLARGAVQVSGGDRKTLTASHHRILNNHIHDFQQWIRTGEPGVVVDGVGQYVAHNLIHDAPFEALTLRGNDHLLEYNEVYGVTRETGDAGAIHTGRDYTWRGNVIRYNYWHDLKGPGLHGVTAVYLDDFSSGFTVTGNVFYRAGRAVQIGGGRDNLVADNLFVECEPAVHVDARGLGWAANYFDGRYPWLFDRFREMHGDQPPYSTRYPALRTLLHDHPAEPKGNRIVHNVSWGGRWLDVYDYFAFDFRACVEMRNNVIADPALWRRRARKDGKPDPYYLNIDAPSGYVLLRQGDPGVAPELAGNTLSARAPGTFDPQTRHFTPDDVATLRHAGFTPPPLEQMGLQQDSWRSSAR